MYPRLKSWASPRKGFRPTTRHLVGGLHAQRSAGANCSVRSGVLSPGFIRRGAGPWRGTFATATRRGDRLAHTVLRTRSVLMCSKIVPRFSNALIPGDLERGCFTPPEWRSERQRHRSRVSAHCRDGLSGAALRRPLHRVHFGPDAVSITNKPTNKSMSVSNEWHGQAPARHIERRRLRAIARSEGQTRRDVGGMASRPIGNPPGRGTELSGTERMRFLPRLKPWVSTLWYL